MNFGTERALSPKAETSHSRRGCPQRIEILS
jgi:hypothetical protein